MQINTLSHEIDYSRETFPLEYTQHRVQSVHILYQHDNMVMSHVNKHGRWKFKKIIT